MDIPQLLAQAADKSGSLLDNLVKTISLNQKDSEKDLINVILILNLDSNFIEFEIKAFQKGESEKKYLYFGNNQSAGVQNYAVRVAAGLKYFFSQNSKNILCSLLKTLPDGELKSLLKECNDMKLFDENGINGNKLNGLNGTVDFKDKTFYLDGEKISDEKLLTKWISASGSQKIILIIPAILKNGERVIVSQHKDYIEMINASLNKGGDNGSHGICHICGRETDTINTKEYSSKLSKSSISKVFVTTQVNTAPDFNQNGHQRNFAICKDCYERMFTGEKRVMSEFKMRIAGEDVITLFEGIDKPLAYDEVAPIKKRIDFAFQPGKVKDWLEDAKDDVQDCQNVGLYQFHILFYKTDGKSCKVKKTIEDISNTRFDIVLDAFRKVSRRMLDFLPLSFTLGDIYNIVPVAKNKKGEQLDVNRLLDLYGSIIKGELVESDEIFSLAAEALGKGTNELNSSELRNYRNLYNIDRYYRLNNTSKTNKRRGNDLFIRQMTLRYLALFEVLQELNIIDKEVFKLDENAIKNTEMSDKIVEKELYLQKHGFSEPAKGLFYLGSLMYWIGEAQKKQGHKEKPILNKISYGGMTAGDIVALYDDLMEKVNQYSKKLSEMKIMSRVNDIISMMSKYIGNLPESKSGISEKAAVFYIMSGYGFSVPIYNKNNNNSDNNEEEKDDAEEQP